MRVYLCLLVGVLGVGSPVRAHTCFPPSNDLFEPSEERPEAELPEKLTVRVSNVRRGFVFDSPMECEKTGSYSLSFSPFDPDLGYLVSPPNPDRELLKMERAFNPRSGLLEFTFGDEDPSAVLEFEVVVTPITKDGVLGKSSKPVRIYHRGKPEEGGCAQSGRNQPISWLWVVIGVALWRRCRSRMG